MANPNLTIEQRFSIAIQLADSGGGEVIVNVPERGFYRLQRIADAEMLAFVLRHQAANADERRPKR